MVLVLDSELQNKKRKTPFLNVRAYLEKSGVFVPQFLEGHFDLGVLLLEDLGDLSLYKKFLIESSKEQKNYGNETDSLLFFYKKAIQELLKIQSLSCKKDQSSCIAFSRSFNKEYFLEEMSLAQEHFLIKKNNIFLNEKQKENLKKDFEKICFYLDQQKKVLCHRDYHSRNLMIHKNEIYVLDFQDARWGPLCYDLVSLLCDSYVFLSEKQISFLLKYYLQQARSFGVEISYEKDFFKIFNYQILQRCFKVCGTFSSFYNLRRDDRYLKYIKPTLQHIKQALQLCPEMENFYNILYQNKVLDNHCG